MHSTFSYATTLNGDIFIVGVTDTRDTRDIFASTTSISNHILDWDASSVTDTIRMLSQAALFSEDISNWDVSIVADMSGMFTTTAISFSVGTSKWHLPSVTNISEVLSLCSRAALLVALTLTQCVRPCSHRGN